MLIKAVKECVCVCVRQSGLCVYMPVDAVQWKLYSGLVVGGNVAEAV